MRLDKQARRTGTSTEANRVIAAGVALLWLVWAVLVWLARRLIYLGIGVGIGYQIAGWAPRPVPAGATIVRVQAAEVAALCDQLKGRAPGSPIGA